MINNKCLIATPPPTLSLAPKEHWSDDVWTHCYLPSVINLHYSFLFCIPAKNVETRGKKSMSEAVDVMMKKGAKRVRRSSLTRFLPSLCRAQRSLCKITIENNDLSIPFYAILFYFPPCIYRR